MLTTVNLCSIVAAVKMTVSKEDYVKAMLEAEAEGQAVISATLTTWLTVSAPAVSMAIRRLRRDGLVRVQRDGRLRLSPAGLQIALRTTLRHHLIERMLAEIFGMEWYRVHDEAERLEHAVSPDFEARLLQKLGRGGKCPHGNLMSPEEPAARRNRGLVLLAEASEGRGYTVDSIYERDRGLLEFLDLRGIRPGARVNVLARNYDQTLTLTTTRGRVSLGGPAAERVWVANESRGFRTTLRNSSTD